MPLPILTTGCSRFAELMEDAERVVGEPGRHLKTVADPREMHRSFMARVPVTDGEPSRVRRAPSAAEPGTASRA
jgi:hypothetical protein